MDGHGRRSLSDDTLEREIAAALRVDPSPEFLPRTRARIASEQMHNGWMWSPYWRWGGAVLAMAAVAIVGVSILSKPTADRSEAGSRASSEAPRREPGDPPVERTLQPARAGGDPAERSPAPARAGAESVERGVALALGRAVEPEVFISQDEASALRQLFAAMSSGRLETSALPDLASASIGPAEIEEIVVAPITIRPLAPPEGE